MPTFLNETPIQIQAIYYIVIVVLGFRLRTKDEGKIIFETAAVAACCHPAHRAKNKILFKKPIANFYFRLRNKQNFVQKKNCKFLDASQT